MASLTITVGSLTSTVSVSDATAQEILGDYSLAYRMPQDGTAQERLDVVTRHIAGHVQGAANGYNQRTAVETERERVSEEVADRRWAQD